MVAITGTAQVATAIPGEGVIETPVPGYLVIFDPALDRAVTTATIGLGGFPASSQIALSIDGQPLSQVVVTDVDGDLGPTSISITREFGAGPHTLTATAGGVSASATFTLARDPSNFPVHQNADADPVYIPQALGSNGVHHWVLQDLMPGGLGSWVMPINPSAMSNPHVRKTVGVAHTTSVEGRPHVAEAAVPLEWQFSGFCPDHGFYNKLVAYAQLARRLYVIDHRNRAWTIAFVDLDMRPRRRVMNDSGVANDWLHDYTASVVLYSQTPKVPVGA